jgi:hypothetical protein
MPGFHFDGMETSIQCQGYPTTSTVNRVQNRPHGFWNDAKSLVQISSAVSTVLRVQDFSFADAASAEQCGYGDLQ